MRTAIKGDGIGGTELSTRGFWLIAACIAALIAFSVIYIDRDVARTMKQAPRVLRDVYEYVTLLGKSEYYLVPSLIAALFFWRRGKKQQLLCARVRDLHRAASAAFIFIAVAFSGILTDIIKQIVGRPRPRMFHDEGMFFDLHPFSFNARFASFPSGHTNTAFAAALALAFFLPRWRVPLLAAAAMVAVSRVMVGAHYPSDTIGGAFIAYLTTYALRQWWEGKYRLPFRMPFRAPAR